MRIEQAALQQLTAEPYLLAQLPAGTRLKVRIDHISPQDGSVMLRMADGSQLRAQLAPGTQLAPGQAVLLEVAATDSQRTVLRIVAQGDGASPGIQRQAAWAALLEGAASGLADVPGAGQMIALSHALALTGSAPRMKAAQQALGILAQMPKATPQAAAFFATDAAMPDAAALEAYLALESGNGLSHDALQSLLTTMPQLLPQETAPALPNSAPADLMAQPSAQETAPALPDSTPADLMAQPQAPEMVPIRQARPPAAPAAPQASADFPADQAGSGDTARTTVQASSLTELQQTPSSPAGSASMTGGIPASPPDVPPVPQAPLPARTDAPADAVPSRMAAPPAAPADSTQALGAGQPVQNTAALRPSAVPGPAIPTAAERPHMPETVVHMPAQPAVQAQAAITAAASAAPPAAPHALADLLPRLISFAVRAGDSSQQLADGLYRAGQSFGREVRTLAAEAEPEITHASPAVQQAAQSLVQAADLSGQMQRFAYLPLPVQVGGQYEMAELFVMKRGGGRSPIDPQDVTLLLALSTPALSRVEGLLRVQGKSVALTLRVQDPAAGDALAQDTAPLSAALAESGYHLAPVKVQPLVQPTTPLNAQLVLQQAFDQPVRPHRLDVTI